MAENPQPKGNEYEVMDCMTYKSKGGGEVMLQKGDKLPVDDISKGDAEIFLGLGYLKEKGAK